MPGSCCLSTVRGEVVANAQEDEELDLLRGEFLTIEPGKFTFYVKYDPTEEEWTRVKKNQEQLIKDRKVIDSASICPDPIINTSTTSVVIAPSGAKKAHGAMDIAPDSKYRVDITPVTTEEKPEAEELPTVDKNIGVRRQVQKDSRAEWCEPD